MKIHLKKIVGGTKLNFKELTTVLTQVEACLKSRPLPVADPDDGVEPLTPGHFLIAKLCQNHLHLTNRCRLYVVGSSVKHSSANFGKGGPRII